VSIRTQSDTDRLHLPELFLHETCYLRARVHVHVIDEHPQYLAFAVPDFVLVLVPMRLVPTLRLLFLRD
jgi:hypothetical protein